MAWTRITNQDEAATLLPAWFGRRIVGSPGRFGLLLTTGDVLRITTIWAVLVSPDGVTLLDVALDHAGPPDAVDLAWHTKHFLGAPFPGGEAATVNLAHVVAAVEFAMPPPPNRRMMTRCRRPTRWWPTSLVLPRRRGLAGATLQTLPRIDRRRRHDPARPPAPEPLSRRLWASRPA